jgi:guanylate kinase
MNTVSRHVFIVVAPSGAGKTSLVSALLELHPDLMLSVSYTTRMPRPGETNGREYHFIDRSEFDRRQAAGDFLESAEVHGNFYGTSRRLIAETLANGQDVLLEIDWQGARQVRRAFAQAIGIFIAPPSMQALEDRLRSRGQDSPQIIERRLKAAAGELAHASDCNYLIVNDDFATALAQLSAIVTASRQQFAVQKATHPDLFLTLGLNGQV